MKKFTYIVACMLALLLTSCTNRQSTYIMPPLHYAGDVSVHIAQPVYIYWERGQELAGSTPTTNAGGIAGMIGAMAEAEDRKNNPGKYHIAYSKAQQASFITNFRDVLSDNRVFKSATIITNPAEANGKGVLMTIRFKAAKVSGYEFNYRITLTVEMKIQSGKSTFTRTYMTESDEGTPFHGKSFDEQTLDASQQLVNELMNGIKQWSRNK